MSTPRFVTDAKERAEFMEAWEATVHLSEFRRGDKLRVVRAGLLG